MNELYDLICELLDKHFFKFDYYATDVLEVSEIFMHIICGHVNDNVLELKTLLENSVRDNTDYLPARYNYNVKDIIGEIPDILIDYYDH